MVASDIAFQGKRLKVSGSWVKILVTKGPGVRQGGGTHGGGNDPQVKEEGKVVGGGETRYARPQDRRQS